MIHIVYAICYYDPSNPLEEVLNLVFLYIIQLYISFLAAGMYYAHCCIFIDDRPSCFHRFRLMASILLMSMGMLDFSLWERMLLFKYFEKSNYILMIRYSWAKIIWDLYWLNKINNINEHIKVKDL